MNAAGDYTGMNSALIRMPAPAGRRRIFNEDKDFGAVGTCRVIDPGYRCRRALIKAPASDKISANSTACTTIVSGIQQYVIVSRAETT